MTRSIFLLQCLFYKYSKSLGFPHRVCASVASLSHSGSPPLPPLLRCQSRRRSSLHQKIAVSPTPIWQGSMNEMSYDQQCYRLCPSRNVLSFHSPIYLCLYLNPEREDKQRLVTSVRLFLACQSAYLGSWKMCKLERLLLSSLSYVSLPHFHLCLNPELDMSTAGKWLVRFPPNLTPSARESQGLCWYWLAAVRGSPVDFSGSASHIVWIPHFLKASNNDTEKPISHWVVSVDEVTQNTRSETFSQQ